MQFWKWFSKEEEPEDDPLREAVEESKKAFLESARIVVESKNKTSDISDVAQGALDILTRVERRNGKSTR